MACHHDGYGDIHAQHSKTWGQEGAKEPTRASAANRSGDSKCRDSIDRAHTVSVMYELA